MICKVLKIRCNIHLNVFTDKNQKYKHMLKEELLKVLRVFDFWQAMISATVRYIYVFHNTL